MIDINWSGIVDIWTYDERHFIGFIIRQGEINSTIRHDAGGGEGSKLTNEHNLLTVDCFRVPTTVTYTYTTTGYYETTVEATQHYTTICSGSGGSSGSGSGGYVGTTYDYNDNLGGSGSYGTVNGTTYTPPTIASPRIIYNQLTNSCASEVFNSLKRNPWNSPFNPGGDNPLANFDFAVEIYELFQKSQLFNLIIRNGNLDGQNGITQPRYNSQTGAKEIVITLSNEYLNKATRLSIARTIIHEMVHGYIIYELNSGNFEFNLYFDENFGKYNSDNRSHHEFMGAYVDMMAYSLKKWDTSFGDGKGLLGDEYYKAMAFGGLFRDKTNIPTDSFKKLVPNSTQRNSIIKIIENEQNGNNLSKGKKCD